MSNKPPGTFTGLSGSVIDNLQTQNITSDINTITINPNGNGFVSIDPSDTLKVNNIMPASGTTVTITGLTPPPYVLPALINVDTINEKTTNGQLVIQTTGTNSVKVENTVFKDDQISNAVTGTYVSIVDPLMTGITDVMVGLTESSVPLCSFTYTVDTGLNVATITLITSNTITFFTNGKRYTVGAGSYPKVHTFTTGNKYLYYNSSGVLTIADSIWTYPLECPLAQVSFDATNKRGIVWGELHCTSMDYKTHMYLHETVGTYVKSGCNYVLNGAIQTDTLTAVCPTLNAGTVQDEDYGSIVNQITSTNGVGNLYGCFWKDGGGVWNWSPRNTPYLYNTVSNEIQWNNASTGALTDITANNTYVNVWHCVSNFAASSSGTNYGHFFIQGQQTFSTLSAAQAEVFLTNNMTLFPIPEFTVKTQITYRHASTYSTTTGRARVEATPVTLLGPSRISITQTANITIHNSLTGRSDQGGHTFGALNPGDVYRIPYGTASGNACTASTNFLYDGTTHTIGTLTLNNSNLISTTSGDLTISPTGDCYIKESLYCYDISDKTKYARFYIDAANKFVALTQSISDGYLRLDSGDNSSIAIGAGSGPLANTVQVGSGTINMGNAGSGVDFCVMNTSNITLKKPLVFSGTINTGTVKTDGWLALDSSNNVIRGTPPGATTSLPITSITSLANNSIPYSASGSYTESSSFQYDGGLFAVTTSATTTGETVRMTRNLDSGTTQIITMGKNVNAGPRIQYNYKSTPGSSSADFGIMDSSAFDGYVNITSSAITHSKPTYITGLYGESGQASLQVGVTTGNRLCIYSTSSIKTKDILNKPIPAFYDNLEKTTPVMFTYKGDDKTEEHLGYIAEILDEVPGFDMFVLYDQFKKPRAIRYEELSVVALECIKEQKKKAKNTINRKKGACKNIFIVIPF